MKIAWCCDKCNWLQVSDSKLRHTMDTCKCGECSIDLEEGYCRMQGNPRTIAVLEDRKGGQADKNKWKVKLTRRNKA